MKTISDKGIELLARLEGMRRHLYLDEGSLPTIGIGHLLTRSEQASGKIVIGEEVCLFSQGLTISQCYQLLKQDLAGPVAAVNQAVMAGINQNQFDALVSFVFNVGGSAFNHSTLLQCINAGEFDQAPEQLRRWVYVNGTRSEGLRRRREAEIVLWITPPIDKSAVDAMIPAGKIDAPAPHKNWLAKLFSYWRWK